jgi:hypothetical protein
MVEMARGLKIRINEVWRKRKKEKGRRRDFSIQHLTTVGAKNLFEEQLTESTIPWFINSKRPVNVYKLRTHLLKGVMERAKSAGLHFSVEGTKVSVGGSEVSFNNINKFWGKIIPGLQEIGLISKPVGVRGEYTKHVNFWVGKGHEENLIRFKEIMDRAEPLFLIKKAAKSVGAHAKKTADGLERKAIIRHVKDVFRELWESEEPLEYYQITASVKERLMKETRQGRIKHEYTPRDIAGIVESAMGLLVSNKSITRAPIYSMNADSDFVSYAFAGPGGVRNLWKLVKGRTRDWRKTIIGRVARTAAEGNLEKETAIRHYLIDLLVHGGVTTSHEVLGFGVEYDKARYALRSTATGLTGFGGVNLTVFEKRAFYGPESGIEIDHYGTKESLDEFERNMPERSMVTTGDYRARIKSALKTLKELKLKEFEGEYRKKHPALSEKRRQEEEKFLKKLKKEAKNA